MIILSPTYLKVDQIHMKFDENRVKLNLNEKESRETLNLSTKKSH